MFIQRARRRASSLSLPVAVIVGRADAAFILEDREVAELEVEELVEVVDLEDRGEPEAAEIGQEFGWEEAPELL